MKTNIFLVVIIVVASGSLGAQQDQADDNVGFTPLVVAVTEVDAIAKAIQGYIDKFHTTPPLRHQQLFPLLDGQNPQKYRFLSLERFKRNGQGEVIDPWKEPYRIEKEDGRIIVSSRKIHYAVTVSKHPSEKH